MICFLNVNQLFDNCSVKVQCVSVVELNCKVPEHVNTPVKYQYVNIVLKVQCLSKCT